LGTPAVAPSDASGLLAAWKESKDPQLEGRGVEGRAKRLVAEAEVKLDALADAVLAAPLRPGSTTAAQRLADMADHLRALESANAGLRAVLAGERSAFAALVPPPGPDDAGPAAHPESQKALREAREEVARLRFELDAVYATRTMRAVQPARRLYSKLRSRSR
jgi:hypothetical protein